MTKIRTRIAPSPTGKFHIGTARTALFNYLFAKKHGGDFLLRFEDTDRERSTKEFEEDIREGLKWLGLDWSEEYKQMDRLSIYKTYSDKLIKDGTAYKKDGAVWFKILEGRVIEVDDLIRGKISFDAKEFNDFVIVKSDDIPTFYFSNVIDDFDMKISHVIRGEDHITNTPKQILISEALGFKLPKFAHIPLILNEDKSKLSKRKNAVSVTDYKNKGYLSEAIVNFLALLGWNPGDERESFDLKELIKEFSLERVQKSPAIFNIEKLNSINSHYIKKLTTKQLNNKIKEVSNIVQKMDDTLFEKAVTITKDRLKYLSEFDELNDFLIELPDYDSNILVFKKSTKEKTLKGLSSVNNELSTLSDNKWNNQEKINDVIVNVVAKEQLDNGDVFWPVRVALSGLEKSPSPSELLWALGKEQSLKRLKKALKKL